MKTPFSFVATTLAIACLVQAAHALPQLRISDGANTITISDNLGGDAQPAPGQVLFVGSLGVWTLNVHTGTTYPAIGTLTSPVLDLSFNATSVAPGTLTVSFSADGFGPTSSVSAQGAVGGTTQGTVLYNSYGGTNNILFNTSNLLTAQGPFPGPAFSGAITSGAINNVGPYSLTQVVTIIHAAAGITTGDALLTTVPESGTSLLLVGVGLMILGMRARFLHPIV